MTQTPAERQARRYARLAAEGKVRVQVFAHADDADKIKEYAAKLAAKREKKGAKNVD